DPVDPDVDGDGFLNEEDDDPLDPLVCRDSDQDGCDDCAEGTGDPAADGPDADGDGVCNVSDPDDDA
ncbi:MAG: hypothetical protein GWN45_02090, partial [Gammaproteobacteria bacterium]|nr:hypothetical protein [Gammaproteobacteria bacterium]